MKTSRMFRLALAIALPAALTMLISSCVKENRLDIQVTTPLDPPTEDAPAVTMDQSYAMYGAFDEEFGYAIGRRMQGMMAPATDAEIFVIDPSSVNNSGVMGQEELKTMIRRIESDEASVVLTKATFREFYNWAQLYVLGYSLIAQENYNGDSGYDSPQAAPARRKMANVMRNAYITGQMNNVQTRATINGMDLDWEHVDTWPEEKQNAVMFDGFAQSGNDELFVMNAEATLNSDAEVSQPENDHEWGHKADAVADWLNHKSEERARTKAGLRLFAQTATKAEDNVAIKDLMDAQTKEFVFDLQYPGISGYYIETAYSALKVQYTVYSAYDFGDNVEYYQVRQNIKVMNDKIYADPGDNWWNRFNDANFNVARGAWMTYIDTKMWLEGYGTKTVVSAGPLNENGSSSNSSSTGGTTTTTAGVSKGYSLGGSATGTFSQGSRFGGALAFIGSGNKTKSYSESKGITWNTTTGWSTRDLSTKYTEVGDANGTVAWAHQGNAPTDLTYKTIDSQTATENIKTLLRSTCVTDEQALWKIENPSGVYTLNASFNVWNQVVLAKWAPAGEYNTAFISHDNPHTISFELSTPDRFKYLWNNVIYKYGNANGDIQLTQILDQFIESTYGKNSANFCWAGLFTSTEATENGSDNARAVFQTFQNSIKGMKVQLYQKGFRGELVFGLKRDGSTGLLESITLDLDDLYNEGETLTEEVNGYLLTFEVTKENKEAELSSVPKDFTGELVIPEQIGAGVNLKVTSLGNSSLQGCNQITSVTIPSSVTFMDYCALTQMDNLSEVHVKATTPPAIYDYWTLHQSCENATLYVPKGCLQTYSNTQYWKDFKNIVEE